MRPHVASRILALALVLATTLAADALSQTPDIATAISHLQYRSIGPALMGGRIADLDVVESRPQTFYVGAASGGVWKTENHGTSWTPLFDDQPTASIGDVTIYQANPNVVWVGTGEPQNRQSSPWGNGVYKSTDAGATWTHMGLEATKHIGRILIHPRKPDVVYVAAVGDLWGPNEERGARDRGMNWEEVGGIDLTKQIDRDTLAIMGVSGSEPQMSVNDGTSTYGNITTLAESPLTRRVIYVGTDDGSLQVSRDDGATWTNVVDNIGGLPDRTYVSRVAPSAHLRG